MKKNIALSLILASIVICNVEAKSQIQQKTQKQVTSNSKTKKTVKLNVKNQCSVGDSRCSYERKDTRTGTTKHFDVYGNLLGQTKP